MRPLIGSARPRRRRMSVVLPAPVRSEEAERTSSRNLQVDGLQREAVAEALAHAGVSMANSVMDPKLRRLPPLRLRLEDRLRGPPHPFG
jgi:hypothetical protein